MTTRRSEYSDPFDFRHYDLWRTTDPTPIGSVTGWADRRPKKPHAYCTPCNIPLVEDAELHMHVVHGWPLGEDPK